MSVNIRLRKVQYECDIKNVEQQAVLSLHRVRDLLVHQRTALINQVRGLLGERGVTIAKSPDAFKRAMPEILSRCEGEITNICQTLLTELLQEFHAVEQHIAHAEAWIKSFMRRSGLCKKIGAIAGVGPGHRHGDRCGPISDGRPLWERRFGGDTLEPKNTKNRKSWRGQPRAMQVRIGDLGLGLGFECPMCLTRMAFAQGPRSRRDR